MFKSNIILQRLIALLITFIIGYIGLIAIHKIFKNIVEELDNSIKNEYSRYKIGEYILKEINSIETKFYEIGIATKIKAIEPLQNEITKEIKDIRKAIQVLQYGGVVESDIKLNLLEKNLITDSIYFKINEKRQYTFEAIDLSPKLDELSNKMYEIKNIMQISLSSSNKSKNNDDIFKVKLFFKQLPTTFIRMKENASRLLHDSKENIELIQNNIKKEKKYYRNLEYIFTFFIIAIVLILGYLVIKQILRDSKKLELITNKAKESEQNAIKANETKSKFLANMSHEIRTPLNAIIGFSDILAQSISEVKSQEKAAIISKSANALLNIINDILDFSKVESGKFEITYGEIKLSDITEQIVELYAVNTKQKNIRFFYNYDERIPEYLISDETRLKQVLSNILSNAIKFTSPDKRVYFNIKLLEYKDNKIKVRFSIKDEGIGISNEDQKKIFDPFSQADGSITRKFGGTGLGLAISLSIIKMLGSEIKIISKENEGSTFYFDLDFKFDKKYIKKENNFEFNFAVCGVISDPENVREHLIGIVKNFGNIYYKEEDIENADKIDLIFCFGDSEFYEKLSRRKKMFNCPVVYVGNMNKIKDSIMKPLMDYFIDVPIYGSKIFNIIAEAKSIEKRKNYFDDNSANAIYDGKILVAEDNTNNQLLIELLLEELGLDVTIVENGQLAFEQYKTNNFDIVFLDINMPVMDGIESCKNIREFEKEINKETPIIALTANAIKGDKEKYLTAGMNQYLTKPIQHKELIKVLNLYLR